MLVSLVDLPGLTPAAVRRLLDVDADLAAAAYDGERGHPVLLGREHWAGVPASAAGDPGASATSPRTSRGWWRSATWPPARTSTQRRRVDRGGPRQA